MTRKLCEPLTIVPRKAGKSTLFARLFSESLGIPYTPPMQSNGDNGKSALSEAWKKSMPNFEEEGK